MFKLKFIHQNSYGPNISFCPIVSIDSLRRSILKCSDESREGIFLLEHHSRKTIVSQFNVTVICDQNVLRLQLSVNDSFIVQGFNSCNNFSHQHFNDVLPEHTSFFLQIIINISSWQIFHNNVNFARVLKCLSNSNKKVTLTNLLYDLALKNICFFYFLLFDYFHSVLFACLFVLSQYNITKCTFT